MNSRGGVDIDWIISLGIFLIYLSLFFLYLTPLANPPVEATTALLADLEDNLKDNATWTVQRIPIFINANVSSKEPIIIGYDKNWQHVSFTDNTSFAVHDGRLMFLQKLTLGKNIKWLVSSIEPYEQPASTDLSATDSGFTINSQRLSVDVDRLVSTIHYNDKLRLSNISYLLGGTNVPISGNSSFNYSSMSAAYGHVSVALNNTAIAFENTSRIVFYSSAIQNEDHNLTLKATLHDYNSYYLDNVLSGTINSTQCSQKVSNYVDFDDGANGISFIFYDNANISFCRSNSTIELSATFSIVNATRYDIILHEGDYLETIELINPYTAKFGIVENISGISYELLESLSSADYSNLKKIWSYPVTRDFNIFLENSTGGILLNYTPKTAGSVNVYTREFEVSLLDKYSNRENRKIRVVGW